MTGSPDPSSLSGVGRSAALLTFATAASQAMLIARDLFVAARVGLALQLDAVLIALTLPTVIAAILSSGTAAALVPAYAATRRAVGPRGAVNLAGAILTWVVLLGIAAAVAMVLGGDAVVSVAAPGFDADARRAAVGYLPLLSPIATAAAASGVLVALLLVEDRIAGIAMATIAGALVAVIVTIGAWDVLGLTAFAIGALLGAVVTLVATAGVAAHAGILPRPRLASGTGGLRPFASHAAPLMVSSVVLQVNVLVGRAVATILAAGAVSALRYGDLIVRAPISVIASAWGQALYPALVGTRSEVPDAGVIATTSIRYIVAVFVPLSIGIAAMAPFIVTVALARGAFGADDVRVTSTVVAAFAPQFLVLMVQPVLVGAHNARRRGGLLLATGTMNAVIASVLTVIAGATLGVVGIAAATSVAGFTVLLFLARRLARYEPTFALRSLLADGMRAFTASLIPAIPVAIFSWYLLRGVDTLGAAAGMLGAGLGATVLYVVFARMLGFGVPATIARTLMTHVTQRAFRRAVRP